MRIAIDTGGTFTDCLFVDRGRIEILKLRSTPANPAHAIREALDQILSRDGAGASAALDLLCGTTVGTNAVLEHRGGRAALVTTAGFEDVLEIGRQARTRLFDLFADRPEPLVPAARRLGLKERVGAEGQVLARPSAADIARIVRRLRGMKAEAVAVCFLFSFLRPEHERAVARSLRQAGFPVSVSHEILPEFREFERVSTTVMNAYLVPVMSRYLGEIERDARAASARASKRMPLRASAARVRIMQSSGGTVSAGLAAREPVRTILSGPAGGVLGAQRVAGLSGFSRVIGFDMGGTSTDVSLIEGDLRTTNESIVAGLPVAVPMLEVHTVGAGGGSMARFDRGGALRVGPESAGVEPGPICYGRGERPTVTDAHLILGRLGAEGLLGGGFELDAARTEHYMRRALRTGRGGRGVGGKAALTAFAEGMLAVVEATMEKAIRVISVERGKDPRDYALVAFGGAGGLHGCALAEKLSIPRVLIPQFPGALSALGILCADVVKDVSRTVLLAVRDARTIGAALRREFARLAREGARTMRGEGFAPGRWRAEQLLDMRYTGQAYELSVAAGGDFVAAFHREHERRYGYADVARPVEIVNVRARFTAAAEPIAWPREREGGAKCAGAIAALRDVWFAGRPWRTAVYEREKLHAGNRLRGPAVIAEYSATTVVPPGWAARVDRHRHLVLSQGGRAS